MFHPNFYVLSPLCSLPRVSCSLPVQVLRAQHNIDDLQSVVLALLIVEAGFIFVIATGYLIFLLRGVAGQRAALFTVFLTIPNTYLKNLASRSTAVGVDDSDEEDDGEVNAAWGCRVQDEWRGGWGKGNGQRQGAGLEGRTGSGPY